MTRLTAPDPCRAHALALRPTARGRVAFSPCAPRPVNDWTIRYAHS